jgi:phosphotransferase system  glucose/maltose/N-acetylglucosamine-specific IIC component
MTADRSLTAANIRKGSHSAFAVPVLQLACKDEAKTSRQLVFIFPAAMVWAAVYCFYFELCFLFFAQAHGGRKTISQIN